MEIFINILPINLITTSVTSAINAANRVMSEQEFKQAPQVDVLLADDAEERLAGLSIPFSGRVDNVEEIGIEEGRIDSFFTLISSVSCPPASPPVGACPLPPA